MTTIRGIELPAQSREHRETVIADDRCPECGGELDTGWECNDCGFDAYPEAMRIDLDDHRRFNTLAALEEE